MTVLILWPCCFTCGGGREQSLTHCRNETLATGAEDCVENSRFSEIWMRSRDLIGALQRAGQLFLAKWADSLMLSQPEGEGGTDLSSKIPIVFFLEREKIWNSLNGWKLHVAVSNQRTSFSREIKKYLPLFAWIAGLLNCIWPLLAKSKIKTLQAKNLSRYAGFWWKKLQCSPI